ncbi:HSP21.5-like protein [Dinothrombium tinctorium]|uniref:HSP21.5-like protein n=1 Tax=Dinothrombium tinctorium TaxID=1965070 RepID=A0A3S3S4R1_9ACAR|nr:HSP21.5-like protein [Dinothrombium tinctorium]RWS09164.1 HSP21.5-like protein [Dinothrombium tinctorium]RWS09169.1 HSP21.5-like protein [Dinothrombium tinctorium]
MAHIKRVSFSPNVVAVPAGVVFSGHFIDAEDLFRSVVVPHIRRQYMQQLKKLAPNSGTSEVRNDKNEFRVQLDVSHFTPEELSVKMLDNNVLVVEGKHEEKADEHGFISRQFTRKYTLPQDVDKHKLSSSFTPNGLLVISAPKLSIEANGNEKAIPIEVKHA